MSEPTGLVVAVLTALAGVRSNQAVVVLGDADVLRRVLEAGTGAKVLDDGPADVVVALAAFDVPQAVMMLKPGGRLVAIAADQGAVERTAMRHGLVLQHMEAVPGRIAWSARTPT